MRTDGSRIVSASTLTPCGRVPVSSSRSHVCWRSVRRARTTRRRTTAAPRQTEHRKSTGPGCEHIVASTGKRFRRPSKNLIYMVDAVAEPTACYDKITFVFDPGDFPDLPPGYIVEYRKPPFVEGINTTTEGFKRRRRCSTSRCSPRPTSTAGSPDRVVRRTGATCASRSRG